MLVKIATLYNVSVGFLLGQESAQQIYGNVVLLSSGCPVNQALYDLQKFLMPNHRTFDFKLLQVGISDRLLWIRLFGTGLSIKDIRSHPLLFGERHGYIKGLRLGNLWIKVLKND